MVGRSVEWLLEMTVWTEMALLSRFKLRATEPARRIGVGRRRTWANMSPQSFLATYAHARAPAETHPTHVTLALWRHIRECFGTACAVQLVALRAKIISSLLRWPVRSLALLSSASQKPPDTVAATATGVYSHIRACLLSRPSLQLLQQLLSIFLNAFENRFRTACSCSFLFLIGAKHSDRLAVWYSVFDQNVPGKVGFNAHYTV